MVVLPLGRAERAVLDLLAAYDSAVSSSLPPPKVTVVRRADQAAFKSLLLDTCATPRPHPLAVPA